MTKRIMIALLLVSVVLLFGISSNATAKRTFRLQEGEIETEVLEKNDRAEVFITVITQNASIDVYVIPSEIYAENAQLLVEFEPLERYTRLNLSTNETYSFTFFEKEYDQYEIILDNSDNVRDNDTAPTTNQTVEVEVTMKFPESGTSTIYKGMIFSFLVFLFCGSVIAKSIRDRMQRRRERKEKRKRDEEDCRRP